MRILFVAANPVDTNRLRLDEEVRTIDERLRSAALRDQFDLVQQWAVRASDLQEALLRYQPQIVHFSGHGSGQGEIVLENRTGQAQTVAPQVLGQLFHTLKDDIRCVVLNACFSATQAQAIVQEIDCVLGMNRAVGDNAAIRFAEGFYRGLGYGRSVQTAFDLGRNMISLEGIDEAGTPQLLVKPGVDASQVVFGEPGGVRGGVHGADAGGVRGGVHGADAGVVAPAPRRLPAQINLTAPQRRDLYNALLGAFPQPGDLVRLVSFHLNENLATIAGGSNLSEAVFSLIQWAEARGRVADLIRAAVDDRPDDQRIHALAAQVGLAAS